MGGNSWSFTLFGGHHVPTQKLAGQNILIKVQFRDGRCYRAPSRPTWRNKVSLIVRPVTRGELVKESIEVSTGLRGVVKV